MQFIYCRIHLFGTWSLVSFDKCVQTCNPLYHQVTEQLLQLRAPLASLRSWPLPPPLSLASADPNYVLLTSNRRLHASTVVSTEGCTQSSRHHRGHDGGHSAAWNFSFRCCTLRCVPAPWVLQPTSALCHQRLPS